MPVDLTSVNWTALVAFGASMVALYGAYRANKIAEKNLSVTTDLEILKYKEKWISELREEMAQYLALVTDDKMKAGDVREAKLRANRIMMRMSRNKPNYQRLRNSLAACVGPVGDDNLKEQDRFAHVCQDILNEEWNEITLKLGKYNAKNQ